MHKRDRIVNKAIKENTKNPKPAGKGSERVVDMAAKKKIVKKKVKKVVKKVIKKKGNYLLTNKLLTIRFWSRSFTTSLFSKQIKNYQITCQYPIDSFNLAILRDTRSAQTYLQYNNKLHIARLNLLHANLDPQMVTMLFEVCNIQTKDAWDMEYATPSVIYEDILAEKKFFIITGKQLDSYIKPLGLSRKVGETDMMFRRRTIEYLNFQLRDNDDVTALDWRKLEEGEE
jgi:hypothetical protein